MARDGEILNSGILQSMADFLHIGGVRRYPKQLNTDQVIPVYDIRPPAQAIAEPGGGEGVWNFMSQQPAVVGNSTFIVDLFNAGLGPTDGVNNAFRIDTIHLTMTFDAAGALAFNGKSMALQLYFHLLDGDPGYIPILTMNNWATVATARLRYYWSFSGGQASPTDAQIHFHNWSGRLPAFTDPFDGPLGLGLNFRVNDGSNVPANTVVFIQYTYRMATNGVVPRA